jgi:hypothetical protein
MSTMPTLIPLPDTGSTAELCRDSSSPLSNAESLTSFSFSKNQVSSSTIYFGIYMSETEVQVYALQEDGTINPIPRSVNPSQLCKYDERKFFLLWSENTPKNVKTDHVCFAVLNCKCPSAILCSLDLYMIGTTGCCFSLGKKISGHYVYDKHTQSLVKFTLASTKELAKILFKEKNPSFFMDEDDYDYPEKSSAEETSEFVIPDDYDPVF